MGDYVFLNKQALKVYESPAECGSVETVRQRGQLTQRREMLSSDWR